MGRGLARSERSESRGFTLIELLIVIALIGILAVALLSAINPLEQLRKGRDSARKADASELLNAVERYYASYQCYPWSANSGGSCNATLVVLSATQTPNFNSGGNVTNLISSNELKTQFEQRLESAGNPSLNKLWMTETGGGANTAGNVAVCYEPESSTGRQGGLGRTTGSVNGAQSTSICTVVYGGGGSSGNCFVCLPQ